MKLREWLPAPMWSRLMDLFKPVFLPMDTLPEQRVLAEIMRMEGFGPELLPELADEIVFDGGHDMHRLKPQDMLDALANKPDAPWRDIAWGLGESFACYFCEFKEKQPSKREAMKLLMCITIFGLSCRHGQSHQFENASTWLFPLVAAIGDLVWDQRLDVMAMALRNWQAGDEKDTGRKRWV